MPHIEQHQNGDFCWFQLSTSDQDGAKAFYSKLFGWTIHDMPMGPSAVYTMFRLDGREAAAAASLSPDQKGVPPHWQLFVKVASADDAAAKAAELGGTVVAGPFDVFDAGRMAVIADPQGAMINVWQPGAHPGTGIAGEYGTACWGELLARDAEAAKTFYSGLFGWEMFASHAGPVYTELGNGDRRIGGLMQITPEMGSMPSAWLVYFNVEDIEASVAQATGLSASVMIPVTPIPNVGRFAYLKDPQGAIFPLIQLDSPA